MGLTSELDPKVAMGIDVPTNKVRDWIKNQDVPHTFPENIRREVDENGEELYRIKLIPSLDDWGYGDITITFKFKFKYESYRNNKDIGFTRGLEPKAAMGIDLATQKVRDWIKKYRIPYFSPESIRRKKNDSTGEFYKLRLIPNLDAWEYGDIEILFQYTEA